MRSKKGYGMHYVAGMLLLLVGVALFTPVVGIITEFISGQGDSVVCTISITGDGTARCPVNNLEIKEKKTEINGKTSIKIGSRTKEQLAQEAIAKELRKCITKGGGLNSRAFEQRSWFGSTVVCLECATVNFDKDFSSAVPRISNFETYLESTSIPTNKEVTYLKSLTLDDGHKEAYLAVGGAKEAKLWPSLNRHTIDTSNSYSIFFVGFKRSSVGSFVNRVWSLDFGGLFNKYLGSNQDAFFAYLAESNDISKLCEVKIN